MATMPAASGRPLPLAARRLRARIGPTHAATAALVALVLVNGWLTPNFATVGNLWNVLLQVSTVVLVSVGMTFVIATGGIDLSVGSVMALSGAIAAVLLDDGIAVALPCALAGGVAVGALNGAFVAYLRVQPIVVTLATLIAVRGLAQVVSHDGELVTIQDAAFAELGRGSLGPVPVRVAIAAIVTLVAAFVLRATDLGQYVLAAGGNRAAARLAGVPVAGTLLTVYVTSGLLAGLAGLIEASRLGASDAANIGSNVELDAIAAAVVGGTVLSGGRATIAGTIVGALIMQVIATSFNMLLIPYAWSLTLKAAILLVAIYVQRPARV
jgi:simple sugar transport system permease protein/ribose transport system permease protein